MTGESPGGGRLGYFPALDGLRAVALLTVLCFHAGFGWVSGGYLPLTSFFVLSGFLITALLLLERDRSGAVGLRRFWARRVRRLFPAAAAGVILAAVFTAAAGTAAQAENLRVDVLAAFANVANWRFVFADQVYGDLFAQPSPLQHYWSLAVEEQFYLLFPLLVAGALALGRGRRWVLAAFLTTGVAGSTLLMRALHQPGDEPLRVYFGSDTRAGEILIGALLALGLVGRGGLREVRPGVARWLDGFGLLALAATVGLWFRMSEFEPRLYEGGLLFISLLAAVVVAACTLSGGVTARLLGTRPLAALGRVSYGVYIFHWPLFLWLDESRTGLSQWPLFGLRMAVTLALAAGCYRLVEQPIRSGWLPRPVAPLAWANATVAACAVAALIVAPSASPTELAFRSGGTALPEGPAPVAPPSPEAAAGTPETAPALPTGGGNAVPVASPDSAPLAAVPAAPVAPGASPSTPAPAAGTTTTVAPPSSPAPVTPATAPPAPPPPPPPLRVMVVGDSLGQNLARGLESFASRTQAMVVWDLTIQGCALSRGGVRRLQNGEDWPVDPSCGWWATQGQAKLAEFKPDIVLVQTGHGEIFDRNLPAWGNEFRRPGDPRFDAWLLSEYQAAADVLGSTGARVVWSVPPCIQADRKPGFIDNTEGNARLRHIGRIMNTTLAGSRPVTLLDVDQAVCPGGRFSDTVAGVANARPDGWHITRAGSSALADQWLAPSLLALR